MDKFNDHQCINTAMYLGVPNSVTEYFKDAGVTLIVLKNELMLPIAECMLNSIGYNNYKIHKSNFTSVIFIIVYL